MACTIAAAPVLLWAVEAAELADSSGVAIRILHRKTQRPSLTGGCGLICRTCARAVCPRPLLVHCELAIARTLQLILIARSRNVITEERSVQQRAGGSRSERIWIGGRWVPSAPRGRRHSVI